MEYDFIDQPIDQIATLDYLDKFNDPIEVEEKQELENTVDFMSTLEEQVFQEQTSQKRLLEEQSADDNKCGLGIGITIGASLLTLISGCFSCHVLKKHDGGGDGCMTCKCFTCCLGCLGVTVGVVGIITGAVFAADDC